MKMKQKTNKKTNVMVDTYNEHVEQCVKGWIVSAAMQMIDNTTKLHISIKHSS